MRDPDIVGYDDGDIDTNPSRGVSLNELVAQRVSRRQTLRGGLQAASVAFLGSTVLTGCGNDAQASAPLKASAGQDVQTSAGRVVTLEGGAVGANATGGSWRQVSGPVVTPLTNSASTLRFVAPGVAVSTPLAFEYTALGSGGAQATATSTVTVAPGQLGFSAVPKSLADVVTVPAGYSVTVLYRLGDPLDAQTSAYANNGTDADFARRAGDHHDGMRFFGLAASGAAPDPASSARGLLAINHENISARYLHPTGQTSSGGARPFAEVVKEIEAHGVSVVEVVRSNGSGSWSYSQSSAFNRRITPFTPVAINGPVRGAAFMRTAYSPDGTAGRGTINNCANGSTAWNTYLTAEENWTGYFRRDASDLTARAALAPKQTVSLARYGRGAAFVGNHSWTTAVSPDAADTRLAKFNVTIDPAKPADGTGDFRHEIFQFGWIVEIDPYDPASTPRKRTALGRMNHEGACSGLFVAGRRPAWYMGDDAQNEYMYKFVSATPWNAADAGVSDRLAIGDRYLDNGTLYVARFDANGTGAWLPLVFGQGPLTPANPAYPFADQADVLANARLAGDALGATRMDRPEWAATNPVNGEVYMTLTNNASRTAATADPANPRAYSDPRLNKPPVTGNANGHIVRLRETGDTTEATS